MNIFQRVSYASKVLLNSNKPNEVYEVGIDKPTKYNRDAVDFKDSTPSKIKRTVKNCRFASRDPQVSGILVDIMTKTNGMYELQGDPKAVAHIEKMSKEWDLTKLFDETIWKGLVDGESFLRRRKVNNRLELSWLAYDGEDYRIKEVHDEECKVIGYKQVVKKNVRTNKGFLRKKFDELTDEEEDIEFTFEADEITHFKFLERDGRGHSPVMNVLDDVQYKRILKDLMPLTVYKNSNIVKVQMGNDQKMNTYLDEDARDNVVNAVSDYHKKGAIVVPYGIEMEVLKGGALSDIPSYLKYFEECIYVGLNTPSAVFSSESSNRATIDVQLDSDRSGRILYFQYIQEWLKKYWEDIFQKELELQGISGEVEIVFLTNFGNDEEEEEQGNEDNDENPQYVTPNTRGKPIRYKGTEEDNRTNSTTIKKDNSTTTGKPKNHDVPNLTDKVNRNKKRKKKKKRNKK